MKQMTHIRKILRPIYGSYQDKCTIDVFDYAKITPGKPNSVISEEGSTIVAAIVKNKTKSESKEKPIDDTLFVFWLANYETVVKDLLLSKMTHLESMGFVYTQNSDSTSKTILKNELWSLYHENSVISASWKKNYDSLTPLNKLFLATLTKSYMAYIWRFNELQDSFEICIQIPLQNDTYGINFQCLWINVESSIVDYNFSSRAFIIFYNTTSPNSYSILNDGPDSEEQFEEVDTENQTGTDLLSNYFNTVKVNGKEEDEKDIDSKATSAGVSEDGSVFGNEDDYVQYFEIYGLDGLYNYQLVVTSEYLVGSNEIMVPTKIKSIESVLICSHTFETGLVTLYTSDSLRPNKITTKFPIIVSKWITLKSTNLTSSYNSIQKGASEVPESRREEEREENYQDKIEELIGMQISKGLNKILPPISLNVINENDISMNILMSPYDLFLKDEHIKESVDNIVGLVIRYMFHATTPLYINLNDQLVYIENYFIDKIKSSKKVKNVKVFSDKDETLYLIHANDGTLSAITSKKHDPNDITHHKIHNLKSVSTFKVLEYHHQLYFIIFSQHKTEVSSETEVMEEAKTGEMEDNLYNCGFYKWENYRLNIKGSWLFRSPYRTSEESERENKDEQLEQAILDFKKWYDSSFFCLLSKFQIITDSPPTRRKENYNGEEAENEDEEVYLYMIKKNTIIKWIEIKNKYYYDLLTNNKYCLFNRGGKKEYTIGNLSIVIKNKNEEYDNIEDEMLKEELVDELPLFMGCNFTNKMYAVYHPESIMTMIKLGLNSMVCKLVNMLVFVFRKILEQLKNEVYCINNTPYEKVGKDEESYINCNCIIYKTLSLKLFCKFNRFFYDYIVKNVFDPKNIGTQFNYGGNKTFNEENESEVKENILKGYVVDDEYNQYFQEYCSLKHEGEILIDELVVYLQVIRIIGLTWYEQYQLINILLNYFSKDEKNIILENNEDINEILKEIEDEDDEEEYKCKLCKNSKILLKVGMKQEPKKVPGDNNILKYLINYLSNVSTSSSYYNAYNTNKNITDLDSIFTKKYEEQFSRKYIKNTDDETPTLSNSPFGKKVEDEESELEREENRVMWLLLVKNDQNMLSELNRFHEEYEKECQMKNKEGVDYMAFLDEIKVGYWIKSKNTMKMLFEKVEKYFKSKVKGYKEIEEYDQFGFFLILQGKVNLFSTLVKLKGFEKLANFLTNDFKQERWKDASIKNAFALISQRRYMLSSGMLILSNRIQDAIDVIYQYTSNLSLCLLVAKQFEFDLQYLFKKIKNEKIQFIMYQTHQIDISELYTMPGNTKVNDEEKNVNKGGEEQEEDFLSKQVESLCNKEEEKRILTKREIKEKGTNILSIKEGNVDDLILNVSIGIVLNNLELSKVEEMIRITSIYYLDKMPIISVLIHSLLTNYTPWDKILIYASNFLHFQKFSTFNHKYDYLDMCNEGLNDTYCNNYYYVDDYKYLDGNVLAEFNNYTFKHVDSRCPILKTLSSILHSKSTSRAKCLKRSSSTLSMTTQLGAQYLSPKRYEGDSEEYKRSLEEGQKVKEESELIVNVRTLSVVESLLKIKSNLKMDLTLTNYKINSNISIKRYDLDIEGIYTRLVNTFIGFLDSNLRVENFNIPSLLMNLIHSLSLLTIYSSNLTSSNENTPTSFDEDEEEAKIASQNRLEVGLYDSDLNLVKEEIVCVCFVVSLSCIFVLMLYKVEVLPQVYNGLYTQLSLLNQMKGNTEWLTQFLESVIKTIEPSLFTNSIYQIKEFNILKKVQATNVRTPTTNRVVTEQEKEDEQNLQGYIGIILTLSMLETILGLMRNYIYKQTNYYHYFWLDRLSLSISRYLFNNKEQLIRMSQKSAKTLYRLNFEYHNPEQENKDGWKYVTEYGDHEDIVNNYVLSKYNNSFYKLWTYLNCNYKLYSLYSNNCNINPYRSNRSLQSAAKESERDQNDKYYDKEDYNELYKILDNYQIMKDENLLIPLIMPLKLIFFKLYYYSDHQIYLRNTIASAKDKKLRDKEGEETEELLKKIINNLRKIRFISLHNAKGRTLSTFYSMPNITVNEQLNHISLQLLVEPIMSDLYMLTELNTNLSLYQLNINLTNAVVNLLMDYNNGQEQTVKEGVRGNNWIILLKLLKYLNRYAKTYVEQLFGIKRNNFKISEKLQTMLKSKDSNNSGAISRHPMWPLYAVAHGSSSEKNFPSYTVSLQHSQVLSTEFKYVKNEIVLNNIINVNNVSTMQPSIFHSNNLFGDLLYIEWSGDSLCLFDKFGWVMIYYMKNLLYLNANNNAVDAGSYGSEKEQVFINTIPTICFKTHFASYHMSWLGEYHILTMGYGLLQESIEEDIVYINLNMKRVESDENVAKRQIELEKNGNENKLKCVGREPVNLKKLNAMSENSTLCICIWNLVEYNLNNIPKIKILMSFNNATNNNANNNTAREQSREEDVRITSLLKLKNESVSNGSKEVGLEYDLLMFDSKGVLRVFSLTDMNIVMSCQLEKTSIVASFLLLNGNFVTVSDEGNIKVYKLASLHKEPELVFETEASVVEPKETTTTTSLVTTIGEFISQRFTRDKHTQVQQPLKIVSVRLYSRQFIAIVYSDEQVSTTQLPNFTVY